MFIILYEVVVLIYNYKYYFIFRIGGSAGYPGLNGPIGSKGQKGSPGITGLIGKKVITSFTFYYFVKI